jgi:hypothetical protein
MACNSHNPRRTCIPNCGSQGKGGNGKTAAGDVASKKISVEEMKKHNKVSDGWCSLGNKVRRPQPLTA